MTCLVGYIEGGFYHGIEVATPDDMGVIRLLREHYKDVGKVKKLVSLGSCIHLRPYLSDFEYDNSFYEGSTFWHRDARHRSLNIISFKVVAGCFSRSLIGDVTHVFAYRPWVQEWSVF